jgi:hypothetical protein
MPGVSVRERDKEEARRVKRALRIEGFPSFVLVSFVFVDAGCACAGEDSKWKLPPAWLVVSFLRRRFGVYW